MTIIGARSFENPEDSFLEQLGVRIYYMGEIQRIVIAQALLEAHYRATQGTAGFGISIDLDALDPKEAPGVGSPERGGLHADQLSAALSKFTNLPELLAIELAEFNPHHDRKHKTVNSMVRLFSALAVNNSND
jgi:arginase family enzyme